MNPKNIYKLTSIGRPLDPAWPTNKAVMFILPVVLLVGFALKMVMGMEAVTALVAGLMLALIAFGGWALARELAPDDGAVAFLSMSLAVAAGWRYEDAGVLVLFATLGLVRLVNRSTGQGARLSDSFILMALIFLVVYGTESPFFALVGIVAFTLDGIFREPVRRHLVFAIFSFIGMVIYMVDHDVIWHILSAPDSLAEWFSVLFLVLFAFTLVLLPKPSSLGDMDQRPLSRKRVRGGMLVGMLAVTQGLNVVQDVVVIASVIAGICIGSVFRKAFSNPTQPRAD